MKGRSLFSHLDLHGGKFLLSRNDKIESRLPRSANATVTNLWANMHSFIGCYVRERRSSGGGYQPAVGRGRRPFLIIHRRWQRRNRRDRDWAEMISARERTRSRAASAEGWEREKEKERGRGAKNEVKFIRVQTDVNLFKLRDFGSGRGESGRVAGRGKERGGGRWGLLRRDGSGSICFITARDKGWAWSEKDSILREIKKSAGLSFRSRFSDRNAKPAGPYSARVRLYTGGDRISRYDVEAERR